MVHEMGTLFAHRANHLSRLGCSTLSLSLFVFDLGSSHLISEALERADIVPQTQILLLLRRFKISLSVNFLADLLLIEQTVVDDDMPLDHLVAILVVAVLLINHYTLLYVFVGFKTLFFATLLRANPPLTHY